MSETLGGGESMGEARSRYGRYEVIGPLGAGGMGIVLEAHDPTLHRKVALKLLKRKQRQSAAEGARRLALEAQAMARLAHPNVVTVYEIDRVGDQVYVAMELVAGTTLRGWLLERSRRWREIVEMFAMAGRGLAAAHAAGLVHRDFKPDNVLIGRDGRPRVCDFGLVVETSADDVGELGELATLDSDATFRGSAAGTPAYMSSEQWSGELVDARSDQFAFCVALWEAVCGSRPFGGVRPKEVRAAVCAGQLVEPANRRVPRWLLAMLRRGLSVQPEARWPDLATLLDALAQRTRAGRRWTIAAMAGVALASAGIATAVVGGRALDPCAAPAERLAAVWSPARGDALRTHLANVDPVQGATRFSKIEAALAAGAQAWSDMHVAACRATRVEGRQSDTLLDRRMDCLDRWLVELRDTVDVIALASGPAAVDRTVQAASSLSPLAACADANALTLAPPPAGADRATAIALADRTLELDVAQRAGRLEGLRTRATELVAAARALDHAPTLAGALAVQVRILNSNGDRAATEPILRELIDVAARAHDDRTEAFAWMHLIVTMSYAMGQYEGAIALVPSARAAVLRAGNPIDLRADLLYQEAIVHDYGPKPAAGLALLKEARKLLEDAGATSPTSPLARRLSDVMLELGNSYMQIDDIDASIAASRASIERWRLVAGVDSADEAFAWHNLSLALLRKSKLDEALLAAHEDVRLRQARIGDSVAVALALVIEGTLLDELGRGDEAVAAFDRSLKISRALLPPGHLNIGHPLTGRAVALVHLGRFDEAARDYGEAIALFDKPDGKTINLPIALANRGDLWARRDRCDEAVRDFTRSIAGFEAVTDPAASQLAYPLAGKGACLVRMGRAAEAIPLLERALRCQTSDGDAFEVARAKAYLGRARVETRRDVVAGLAMARGAREGLAAWRHGTDELRRLDRWLSAHAR